MPSAHDVLLGGRALGDLIKIYQSATMSGAVCKDDQGALHRSLLSTQADDAMVYETTVYPYCYPDAQGVCQRKKCDECVQHTASWEKPHGAGPDIF